MTTAIMAIYQTNEITGGIASDILRASEHEDFDSYVIAGGQLARVKSFYDVRVLVASIIG